jgi:hypothetical protein
MFCVHADPLMNESDQGTVRVSRIIIVGAFTIASNEMDSIAWIQA